MFEVLQVISLDPYEKEHYLWVPPMTDHPIAVPYVLPLKSVIAGHSIIKGKILLGNESQVTGNLKSGTLVIEEGAKFAGTCDMSNSNILEK